MATETKTHETTAPAGVEYVALAQGGDYLSCGTGATPVDALRAALEQEFAHSAAEIEQMLAAYTATGEPRDTLGGEYEDYGVVEIPAGLLPELPGSERAFRLWCLVDGREVVIEDLTETFTGFGDGTAASRIARALQGLGPVDRNLCWPEFPSREPDVAQRRFLSAREALETFPHLIVDLDAWLAALALAYPAGKLVQDAVAQVTFSYLTGARFYPDHVAFSQLVHGDAYVPVELPRCCVTPDATGLRASELGPVYLALLTFYRRAQAATEEESK